MAVCHKFLRVAQMGDCVHPLHAVPFAVSTVFSLPCHAATPLLSRYRRKHRHVDLNVIKRWAWQILQVGRGSRRAPGARRPRQCCLAAAGRTASGMQAAAYDDGCTSHLRCGSGDRWVCGRPQGSVHACGRALWRRPRQGMVPKRPAVALCWRCNLPPPPAGPCVPARPQPAHHPPG